MVENVHNHPIERGNFKDFAEAKVLMSPTDAHI